MKPRQAADILRRWFQSSEPVDSEPLQEAVTTAIAALDAKADADAWDEDDADMQQIAREWAEYDRDPEGS